MRGLIARVALESGGRLAVSYLIEGDIERLRVPAPGAPRPADRLWEHTCCELFVGSKGERAYSEYNFSPSGEWSAYAFESYRVPLAKAPPAGPPRIKVRADSSFLELDALIAVDGLAPGARPRLALGISAVLEDDTGRLSYWALRHPSGKPDFHHPDAFALELAA